MEQSWLKNYPAHIPHKIDPNSYNSITEMVAQTCNKFAERDAFINMGASITFSELDQLTDDFASFLQSTCKLKAGDKVALQMPNLLQYPIALFGALKAGMVVVNTNPLYTAREMEHQFKDSGAKAIVILANFAHILEEVLPKTDIEHVVVTEIGDQLGWPKSLLINSVVKYIKKMVPKYKLPQAYSFYEALDLGTENKVQPVEIKSEDIAFLQYTGGTTGVSKGAMLTHKNIISNMLQVGEWIKPLLKEGEEVAVTALPLYHIFSLTANCLSFMRYGTTNLLITNPKDIPGFIKTLKSNHYTVMSGVNTLFNTLMNNDEFTGLDFSKLKVSVAGGMALQNAVAKKWEDITQSPIVEGYGLTETSPVASCNPVDGTARVGTIGLPLPSTDMKILDENEKELPVGEVGEICIFGPQVMKGYWQRPKETHQVMTQDGGLKTGDIGRVDADGFFKIVDRKKDMILVSGFNVYPNEVEDEVAKMDKVLEVAAIGVPDEHSGEVVKVFIVPKDKSLTADEVKAFCKDSLTAYKRPKQVEFKDDLPKTNVGKILRRELR